MHGRTKNLWLKIFPSKRRDKTKFLPCAGIKRILLASKQVDYQPIILATLKLLMVGY